MAKLTGGPLPDVKFFNMTDFTIAGHRVRALRHGMAGQPGFELFGPWAEGDEVLHAILEAGAEFGLMRAGAKAYSTSNLESGWIPTAVPAIFGPEMRGYREWLDAGALGSLGGSMDSGDITDYYVTPYDIGYGRTVKFDHDFLGREALERVAAEEHRGEGDAGVEPRRPRPRRPVAVRAGHPGQVHRDAEGPLRVLPGRQGAAERADRRAFARPRLPRQRARVRVAGDGRRGRQRARHGGHGAVGRAPELRQARRRAPPQVGIRATVAPAPFVREVRDSYRSR